MSKETELHSFYKKCESIRKAYRLDDEDCDAVDGIMDELRQAKNKLVSFVKEAVASEQFKEIRKELFEIIVEVIREPSEQDIEHIITRLIKLMLSPHSFKEIKDKLLKYCFIPFQNVRSHCSTLRVI